MSEKRDTEKKVRICGLWKNESKAGTTYWKGTSGYNNYLIFEEKLRNPKSPPFGLYITERERNEDERGSAYEKGKPGVNEGDGEIDKLPF